MGCGAAKRFLVLMARIATLQASKWSTAAKTATGLPYGRRCGHSKSFSRTKRSSRARETRMALTMRGRAHTSRWFGFSGVALDAKVPPWSIPGAAARRMSS